MFLFSAAILSVNFTEFSIAMILSIATSSVASFEVSSFSDTMTSVSDGAIAAFVVAAGVNAVNAAIAIAVSFCLVINASFFL